MSRTWVFNRKENTLSCDGFSYACIVLNKSQYNDADRKEIKKAHKKNMFMIILMITENGQRIRLTKPKFQG